MNAEQEHLESVVGLPRGGYDPDVHGYWFEHQKTCHLRQHGGFGNECDCSFSAVKQAVTDVHTMQEAVMHIEQFGKGKQDENLSNK